MLAEGGPVLSQEGALGEAHGYPTQKSTSWNGKILGRLKQLHTSMSIRWHVPCCRMCIS